MKDVCYRVDNGLVVAIKDANSTWGVKETDGDLFLVAQIDPTQEILDYVDGFGIIISDGITEGCLKVDNVNSPTSIIIM
jgi:hypothetical protein